METSKIYSPKQTLIKQNPNIQQLIVEISRKRNPPIGDIKPENNRDEGIPTTSASK